MSNSLTSKNKNPQFGIIDYENNSIAKTERQNELFNNISLSEESNKKLFVKYNNKQVEKFKKTLNRYKYGLNASAPIICMGPEKCPFFHACPIGNGIKVDPVINKKVPIYDSLQDFPIGEMCSLELNFMEDRLKSYLNEFDVDPINASELALVNDLSLVDLYKNRCVLYLSAGDLQNEGIDFFKSEEAYDLQGNLINRKYQEHPILNVMEKLEKRRHRILEELIATRKSKMNIMVKIKESQEDSRMLTEIETIRKALESSDNESKDDIIIEIE